MSTMKTPEQISSTATNDWLNTYEWPYSECREFSATELADAVEGLIAEAIEADRAQRTVAHGVMYSDVDEMLTEWEDFDGDVSYFYDKWVAILRDRADWTASRIAELTAEWEEATNYGADEPHRASDYALTEDDWRAGLSDEDAAEIVRLIEWREAQK